MQYKIINSINNGNTTVEQIMADTKISPKALEITLKELVSSGILGINADGSYYNAVYESPVQQPVTTNQFSKNKRGDKMNQKSTQKTLQMTPEQQAFASLVQRNKGIIFDANQVLMHRGAQVLFAGAGKQAFRYKLAIAGFSDKEAVEYPVLYLDWDDSALYDEGGLADQIREIVGESSPQPQIKPAIQAVL